MKENTAAWLKKQVRGSALIGGILSIVHPELFTAGVNSLKAMNETSDLICKGHRLAAVLRIWSSPFTAITTISNRDTPFHRDNSASPQVQWLPSQAEFYNTVQVVLGTEPALHIT